MLINPCYIEGLSETEAKIKKLILFCIEEGINISEVLTDESGIVVTKAEYNHVIEKLIVEDYNKRLLGTNYKNNGSRLVLTKPLFIYSQVDGDLNRVRDYFTASNCGQVGYAGDPVTVLPKLKLFLETNGITLEEAEEAAKIYVESCVQTGRMMKMFDNFIEDDKGSTLRIFVEEIKQRKSTSYDLSKFI
jgi:predicted HAD superfamily hydrolase